MFPISILPTEKKDSECSTSDGQHSLRDVAEGTCPSQRTQQTPEERSGTLNEMSQKTSEVCEVQEDRYLK